MKRDGGLRLLFRQNLPQFHWVSIETGATAAGVPDSNYCFNGTEGWLEFKTTAGWTVPLRPAQIGWLLRRSRARGRVFVAVRQVRPNGDDILWLALGSHAAALRDKGLRGAPMLGCWPGGPSLWPWDAIKGLL